MKKYRDYYNRSRIIVYRYDPATDTATEIVNLPRTLDNMLKVERVISRICDRIVTENPRIWYESRRYYMREEHRPLTA